MRHRIFLIIIGLLLLNFSFGQILIDAVSGEISKDTVMDVDGNIYHTVKIGNQIWMVENLKTTKYRDGTEISNVSDTSAWSELTTGAYSDYFNKPDNTEKYGRLYNWFAVDNSRKICPEGWHVPTYSEWESLKNTINNNSNNNEAKEYKGWWSYRINGDSLLPIDYRDSKGAFHNEKIQGNIYIGSYGGWWTSTQLDDLTAWQVSVGFSSYFMLFNKSSKKAGYSVLCIKEAI